MAEKSKLDYSEYHIDDYDRHFAVIEGNSLIRFNFYNNTVLFRREGREICIRVDCRNEYFVMNELLKEVDQQLKEHGETTVFLSDHESEEDRKARIEGVEKNVDELERLQSRYSIDRSWTNERIGTYLHMDPNNELEPMLNVLSGTEITLSLGEGILDFVYADFKKPSIHSVRVQYIFEHLDMILELPERPEIDRKPIDKPEKVYSYLHERAISYCRYMSSITLIKDIMYASLYSAICPPIIKTDYMTLKALKRYYAYLAYLQEWYLELIEFCFDEDFYPDVLGHLQPHERYALYQDLHNFSLISTHVEEFRLDRRNMSGEQKPYGMDIEEIRGRWGMKIERGVQFTEFCEKFKIPADRLDFHMRLPLFLTRQYSFSSVAEILELEFTQILEHGVRFRKCKRCGKYFIMKGNYDTNYCDRIAPGETKNCQEIAAQENYRAKVAANPALPIYNRYYKRYSARVKSRQIKEADFKAWKYQALTKRDECSDGIITPEEYIEWMESCFPNRSHKTTA